MINYLELSTGIAGAKPVMDQTHTDGFPVRRIKSELKITTGSGKVHVERKTAADDSSSSRKPNATSLKLLLAKEMSKEAESKRKPPSVVARLMGLEEDRPAKESVLYHAQRDLRKSQSCNHLKVTNKTLQQQDKHHFIQSCETVEYNDVYEVCEEQSSMSFFQDQTLQKGLFSGNKSDRRVIVGEKFIEAKCFAAEEKLLHSEKLQEALEVLSSNKDIYLKFLEKPNCIFSRQLSGLHTTPAPPRTRRITILKPIGSVESNGIGQSRTERVCKKNGLEMRKFHERSSLKEGIPSPPNRIVLLRPTPGKTSIAKAKLSPRATSFQPIDWHDFNRALDDNRATLGSTGVVNGIIQHQQDGCHRCDESLLSSAYSNGYGGDESSFSDSEIDHQGDSDYMEEDGGSFSDSEGGSPLSKCCCDYIKRHGSPYSGSSFSKISHFLESSVIREAKQRLSERWTMVTCDEISQEQVQLPRSTCTLGEMLSLQEVKKEDSVVHSVSSNQSCVAENDVTRATYGTTCRKDDENRERSPRMLPRSNSVPVISSTFDNMVANAQASNPQGCTQPKDILMTNKGKSSFKERVSDFFFSRSKKPIKQKYIHHLSGCFDERVEACFADSQSDANHNLETNIKVSLCEDTIDISAMQKSTSRSEGTASIDVPISLVCPSGKMDRLRLSEGLNNNRDQPSPTSVLYAPSEDSSCNEPESSGSTTSKNAKTVSRSSVIEAVACSLSWDDASSESPLLGTSRLPYLLSDVDDDESECHVLVQNIMSSAGLDNERLSMVFTGWHLPDCLLDPVLCDKVLELRERSSYRRLLFDCVNAALVEIGENALLSTFPWSKTHTRTWRDTSSPVLGVEVWSILKEWIYGARVFVVGKRDNAGIIMDRIVKQEVEGRGWVNMMRSQVVDITEHIQRGVLEELVGEAVLDFATCFQL